MGFELLQRNQDVVGAAEARIEYLYNHFENIIVSWSGGKDSLVVLNLAITVAKRLGKPPVNVYFLDQEFEWNSTIDTTRIWAEHEHVDFHWYQIPVTLFNSANSADPWITIFDPECQDKWIRPYEPGSIRENPYPKKKRFYDWLGAHEVATPSTASLNGVRIQESMSRRMGMLNNLCYRQITWGAKTDDPTVFKMSPIWDWHVNDVWKYIFDNDLHYNEIYNKQFAHGVKLNEMRVSAFIHESSIKSLYNVERFEPEVWAKAAERCEGIHTARNMNLSEAFKAPETLPYMFEDWREYRDHLIENVVADKQKKQITQACLRHDRYIKGTPFDDEKAVKKQIQGVLQGYKTKIDSAISTDRLRIKKWIELEGGERAY